MKTTSIFWATTETAPYSTATYAAATAAGAAQIVTLPYRNFIVGVNTVSVSDNAPILAQIAAIESTQHRAVRDFILRNDKTRVVQYDAEIAALRAQLV